MDNRIILEPGDIMTVGKITIEAKTPMIYKDGFFYEEGYIVPKTTTELVCHCKKCHTRMAISSVITQADGFKLVKLTCPEKALWRPGHEEALYNSYNGEIFSRIK